MTYRIPLPGRSGSIDIIDPNATAVQRALRRDGLAGYEPSTIATLLTLFDEHSEGLSFFDVGANMGLYALLCAAIFDPDEVHAFEPTPTTVDVLRKIVRTNRFNVEVVAEALGDVNSTANLHLSTASDSSNSLVEGFKQSTETVSVPVRRLDDYVAASGVAPTIMKIDVETHEPAVLAGASETIARHRPYIVIEVLYRRRRDHGVEITEVMAPHGYTYYRLDEAPSWTAESIVTGTRGRTDSDWLLAPEPLNADFEDRWMGWKGRLAECGPERNSRVPIIRSIEAATRRGGPKEAVAAARRFIAAVRRERGQRSS